MTLPTSVTIDEAVALLINFPHFDTSYSLLDILSFLAEEAEVRYEKGVAAGVPEKESWRAAFGLMVTIVWLYLEVLRLLSILRNDR